MQDYCGVFVVSELGEIGVYKGDNYIVAKVEPYGLAFNDSGKVLVLYDTVNLYENLMEFISKELNGCRRLSLELDAKEIKVDSVKALFKTFDYTTLLYLLALKSRPSLIHVVGYRGRQRRPAQSVGKIMARASPIPPEYVAKRPPPFALPADVKKLSITARRTSGERYKVLVKIEGRAVATRFKVVETEDLYRRVVGGLVSSLPHLSWVEYAFL
ncbi:MAG: hypothetical protein ABWJ97_00590 [Thermoproteus sp.]